VRRVTARRGISRLVGLWPGQGGLLGASPGVASHGRYPRM